MGLSVGGVEVGLEARTHQPTPKPLLCSMHSGTCSLSKLWASTPLVILAAFHNPGGGSCHPHIPGQEPSPLSEVTWQGRRGLAAFNLSSRHEDVALCHPPPGWQQMEGNCPPAAMLASVHSYREWTLWLGSIGPLPSSCSLASGASL